MSTTSIERTDFSQRLLAVLASARGLGGSPTTLAREFNQIFVGNPVTVHAARKWLLGEAIPTQEKMQALARWLDVPVNWLRFGGDANACVPSDQTSGHAREPETKMDALVRLYRGLPDRDRAMAKQFIAMLANQQPREAAEHAAMSDSVSLS